MTNTLGAKPKIDTSEFQSGIRQMNSELRRLESGFKAAAATMADWTQDSTLLEQRINMLNSSIDVQKQKVAATRAEWERVKREKGENSLAANKLETDLNKETETLNKMERELGETENALDKMQSGTEATSDSVDDLGDQTDETSEKLVSFQDVLAGMKGIAAGVVTVVAGLAVAVAGAAVAIGGLVFNAAEAAGELVDMSAKTGISVERLQELQYVGDQVGTSLDTITGAQARLIRSMDAAAEGSKTQEEAFERLGVSVTDVNGNLRNQEDVFLELLDALGAIENPAERDALAMELFGKSAQELNPLIKAGSSELAQLAQQAHDVGAVMDEDAVAGLEGFGDTMASLQAGLKGTLGTLAAEFLPAFQEVASALQDLFKSDEFKARLTEIGAVIRDVVSVAVEVIGKLVSGDFEGALASIFGSQNAAGMVAFFETIRKFIFETLIPFVTTHAQEIKAALIGIGAALAAAGIVGAIAGIIAALNPVTLIIGAIVAVVGLLSAAWAGNWGGIRDTLTNIWENYLRPALETLWNFLSVAIPAAIEIVTAYWTGTLLPALQTIWAFLSNYVFPLFQAIATFLDAVFGLILRTLAAIWENNLLPALRSVWAMLSDNVLPIFRAVNDFIDKNIRPIFEWLANFVNKNLTPAFQGIADVISGVIDYLLLMADTLNNLEVPDVFMPGSPTPFEVGLVGITRALRELNQQLPVLAQGLTMQPTGAPLGYGTVDQSQNSSVQVFGNVILRGETPAGSLGAALKGRSY
jgi:hypothetical protein